MANFLIKRFVNPFSITFTPAWRRIYFHHTECRSRQLTTATAVQTSLLKPSQSSGTKTSKPKKDTVNGKKGAPVLKNGGKEADVKANDSKDKALKFAKRTAKFNPKSVAREGKKAKISSVTARIYDSKLASQAELEESFENYGVEEIVTQISDVESEKIEDKELLSGPLSDKGFASAKRGRKRGKEANESLYEKDLDAGKEETAGSKFYDITTIVEEIKGYLTLGQVNKAQKYLNRFLRTGKTLDISTFNRTLFGWAEHGNCLGVKMTLRLLKSDGLKPDLSTYAALLYFYGKLNETEKLKEILHEMKENELNPQNIFYKCMLTENQAKGVMTAVCQVDPYFKASIPEEYHSVEYLSLVKSLYDSMDANYKDEDVRLSDVVKEDDLQDLLKEQLSRELNGSTVIKSIEDAPQEVTGDAMKLKELYKTWREKAKESLMAAINKELEDIKQEKFKSSRNRYAPFIQAFDAEELADIALHQVLYTIKGHIDGMSLSSLSGAVGSTLYDKYLVKQKVRAGVLKKIKNIYLEYVSFVMDERHTSKKMARDKWDELDLGRPYEASLNQDVADWSWGTKLICGCALIELLLNSVTVDVNVLNHKAESQMAAFYHTYEFKGHRKIGVIRPHQIVCKLFKGYMKDHGNIVMETTSLPMLVPPRPWREVRDGAFLLQPVHLMRGKNEDDSRQDRVLEEKTSKHQLCSVFDALNSLGSCAWRTNDRILDLAIHYFNNGGNDVLAIPGEVVQPDSADFEKPGLSHGQRIIAAHEYRCARKEAKEQYSLRMTALYKLSVANHFRKNVFWLPLNMDFRGRVYPIPPHCCHMGDDLSRGMLQFAKGVPLGEHGLRWLKIHLTNLHGAKKKASLNEREEFANEMMDEIIDSADNPLTGRQWWMTAELPWQALATCIDITNASRSEDHTQYISHHPVHQDGSCNGLQHYAALGRDSYGAKQVNLVQADRPQDVYEEVVKLVEEARAKDAKKGHKIAQQLEGIVKRKVIKQTVMTIVYGVTMAGGRLQIERQLKDLDMDDKILFDSSLYLAHKVFGSIGQLFNRAKAIQDWLALAATHISYSGHMVDWYTPLSLYIFQPYFKRASKVISSKLQKIEIPVKSMAAPDTRKQQGAFPPNFVHSLDSTHMMLTALYSQRAGITFTSVHDSFWTHAANVDTMNKICREQFIALHSQPILQDLQKHFNENYAGLQFLQPLKRKKDKFSVTEASFDNLPELGDFDLKQVQDSTYFFS